MHDKGKDMKESMSNSTWNRQISKERRNMVKLASSNGRLVFITADLLGRPKPTNTENSYIVQ